MTLPNSPTNSSAPRVPLRSTFSSDPDMLELIQEFAAEMPGKAEQVLSLWEQRNLGELKRLSHQLKGASGGYGFSTLGECAGRLEASLKNDEQNIATLKSQIDELVNLCSRVSA